MAKLKRFNLTGKKYLPLVIIILPLALIFNIVLVTLLLLNPRSWKFDKEDAREVLNKELQRFREMSYQECLQYVDEDSAYHAMVMSDSGIEYQIDVQILRDGGSNEALQVIGSVDDGGLRAYVPMSDSFFVDPDDTSTET